MSTSVKISRDYKNRLDKLQASLLLSTGKKVSQQELLEMLVQLGIELEDKLQEKVSDEPKTIDPKTITEIMEMPTDWGFETSEETLDKTIYGEEL